MVTQHSSGITVRVNTQWLVGLFTESRSESLFEKKKRSLQIRPNKKLPNESVVSRLFQLYSWGMSPKEYAINPANRTNTKVLASQPVKSLLRRSNNTVCQSHSTEGLPWLSLRTYLVEYYPGLVS